jgi:hypothetical protein
MEINQDLIDRGNQVLRDLRQVESRYRAKEEAIPPHTGDVIVSDMARDSANIIQELLDELESKYDLCKSIIDDMKILEADMAYL